MIISELKIWSPFYDSLFESLLAETAHISPDSNEHMTDPSRLDFSLKRLSGE